MIPTEMMPALRSHIAKRPQAGLLAATANFDETCRHLRIDFFFSGTSEDVDFEELEAGVLAELIAEIWAAVETVGFAVFFDAPAAARAALDSSRLFPD